MIWFRLYLVYSGSEKQIQGIRSDRQSAWRTMDIGSWHPTGGNDQDHPQEKKKCKKAKWLSEEVLKIAEKSREVKGKGEKERYIHLNVEFPRIASLDKKAFNEQWKEIQEKTRMGD